MANELKKIHQLKLLLQDSNSLTDIKNKDDEFDNDDFVIDSIDMDTKYSKIGHSIV